jgi:expansin (peptidoglycan-binding protein)
VACPSAQQCNASGACVTAPVCTFGTAFNGNGSFTFYFFGQGTAMQGGLFKTACGYTGTESGTGMTAVDTVTNIANTPPARNTYFVAIPSASSSNFSTVTSCGACVQITNGATKIIATVIDACPADTNPACTSGHLDLSTQAFDALGYAVGNPSGTTWQFVPCPVTGNIKAVQNGNAANQYYLQNAAYPISSVNGAGPNNFGVFTVSPGAVTVTSSVANQTITVTIPSGGGDTGAQFTGAAACFPAVGAAL